MTHIIMKSILRKTKEVSPLCILRLKNNNLSEFLIEHLVFRDEVPLMVDMQHLESILLLFKGTRCLGSDKLAV